MEYHKEIGIKKKILIRNRKFIFDNIHKKKQQIPINIFCLDMSNYYVNI